ncbi:hypothetical protein [Rhodopirellula sp. MGV]|uniref:hypothetical protein n=1 Tax=Rhodopirellula sp. MGV TaxID=2023130 RepID=UPI000B95CC01|nr:hypothetical protein [Rhodopirellula sp. MGV]OYP37035.1 hypothetical protein CGZ80_06700 [Rhodopirellula sp. MGV]PNY36203.1 hypothetical protein C2E31_13885 [Rhodopirellula baltica]
MLDRDEYVEQAHLFELLYEQAGTRSPIQDLLEQLRHEVLATTRLPMAMEYLLTEVRHSGLLGPAMHQLSHYFTPFQTFLIDQSELDTGRFLMHTAFKVMQSEVEYRVKGASQAGLFFYQFEVLCRNRLSYDLGLTAMSGDPLYDDTWSQWILKLRAEVGLIDFADLVFLASEDYRNRLKAAKKAEEAPVTILFGEKEGRIAFANRRKDPLYLFSALQRHLGYPQVPRPKPLDENNELIPQMARRLERLEARIQLMEEERRQSLDITKFYEQNKHRLRFPD